MSFAEPVIGLATSGRTRWLNPSYGAYSTRTPGLLPLMNSMPAFSSAC